MSWMWKKYYTSNQMPLVGNVMSNSLSAEKEKGKEKHLEK